MIQIPAALAVIAGVFLVALPRIVSYGEVWRQLRMIDGSTLAVLAVVTAANLLAPALSFKAALPGLRLGPGVVMDWTTTAVTNTVPGGSAIAVGLTWSILRSFRLDGEAAARAIVVTGVLDVLVKLGTPLPAVAWLATGRPVGAGLIQAAVFGGLLALGAVGLSAALLAGPGVARLMGRLLDRAPIIGDGWIERLDRLRSDTVTLLSRRWRPMVAWTLFGHANLFLLLLLCLRATGADADQLSPAAILAAFAFGRLVTAVPLTPGGLGVLELSVVGALNMVGEAEQASVVAALLLFRFATLALPVPLGAATGLWWHRTRAAGA